MAVGTEGTRGGQSAKVLIEAHTLMCQGAERKLEGCCCRATVVYRAGDGVETKTEQACKLSNDGEGFC